ncbi:MAG: methytransferase partner Trm112 [Dehalococcoidia bacterium]|nr:methytransferase partner Trm112 [Dehalococcoidia bacterium]
MKKELMQILVCPVCKGPLQLKVDREEGEEVIGGSLYCFSCRHSYPIEDAIPNLLPPDLGKAQG